MDEDIRFDKWLRVARFVKTRSLAADAVSGGKIEINGDRAKPSRGVRVGDKVDEYCHICIACARPGRSSAKALLKLDRPPDLNLPSHLSTKRPTCDCAVRQARLVRGACVRNCFLDLAD
jgi:hypothetical protein